MKKVAFCAAALLLFSASAQDWQSVSEPEDALCLFYAEMMSHYATGTCALPSAWKCAAFEERMKAFYKRQVFDPLMKESEIAGRMPGSRSMMSVLFPSLHERFAAFANPAAEAPSDGEIEPDEYSYLEEILQGSEAAADLAGASGLRYRIDGGILRTMALDDERVSVYEGRGGSKFVVIADSGKIVRIRSDERWRVLCRERYSSGADGISLVLKAEYRYGGSDSPSSCVTERVPEGLVEEEAFDGGGRVIKRQVFSIKEEKEEEKKEEVPPEGKEGSPQGKAEKTRRLVETREWAYDGQGRIVREASQKEEGRTERLYSYGGLSKSADFEYYEDGVLRQRTTYTAEDEYVQTTYFDGGFRAEARYADGLRVSERVYMEGEGLLGQDSAQAGLPKVDSPPEFEPPREDIPKEPPPEGSLPATNPSEAGAAGGFSRRSRRVRSQD